MKKNIEVKEPSFWWDMVSYWTEFHPLGDKFLREQ